jgi:hypothetical protein
VRFAQVSCEGAKSLDRSADRPDATKMKRFLFVIGLTFLASASTRAAPSETVIVEGFSDFDGDRLVGDAEDSDGDLVFGSVTQAITAVGEAGRVIIATSGEFRETVAIGNVRSLVLEAAPGVFAIIRAPDGSAPDVAATTISAPAKRSFVQVRNITFADSPIGMKLSSEGDLQVSLENCRLENNVTYGLLCTGGIRLTMRNCTVSNTDPVRFFDLVVGPPFRGTAISLTTSPNSEAFIYDCTIVGNRSGILLPPGGEGNVKLREKDNLIRNRDTGLIPLSPRQP